MTLLRAIHKLLPTRLQQPTQNPASIPLTDASLVNSGPRNALQGYETEMVLPSPSEICPLVDAYFRYFRMMAHLVSAECC